MMFHHVCAYPKLTLLPAQSFGNSEKSPNKYRAKARKRDSVPDPLRALDAESRSSSSLAGGARFILPRWPRSSDPLKDPRRIIGDADDW